MQTSTLAILHLGNFKLWDFQTFHWEAYTLRIWGSILQQMGKKQLEEEKKKLKSKNWYLIVE